MAASHCRDSRAFHLSATTVAAAHVQSLWISALLAIMLPVLVIMRFLRTAATSEAPHFDSVGITAAQRALFAAAACIAQRWEWLETTYSELLDSHPSSMTLEINNDGSSVVASHSTRMCVWTSLTPLPTSLKYVQPLHTRRCIACIALYEKCRHHKFFFLFRRMTRSPASLY